jgi:hypothetical protein
MDFPSPAYLAFVVAVVFTWLDLVTSKYQHTFSFIGHCWALWVYVLFYGSVSFACMHGIDALKASKQVEFDSSLIKNPWILAIIVGISAKSFLHIRLLNINTASGSIPIGVETILFPIQAWVLPKIHYCEYECVRLFVRPRAASYKDREECKRIFLDNAPDMKDPDALKALTIDLEKQSNSLELMELFLRRYGKGMFDLAFPTRL